MSISLSLCVCHPSFSLILWWKQLCVECFIPRDDWHPFKLLPSCSCETVSLYLALSVCLSLCDLCCTDHMLTDIHQAIFCFLSASSPLLSRVWSASIPFFACELKAVTPYKQGFFCGDSSITYPYVEREAIPDGLLIAGGIAITGLTVRQG